MCSRVFMFLIGAMYINYQVLASDVYIAELMVESNVTLEAQTILSVLNTTDLQVTSTSGVSHTVALLHSELIAECLIVGDKSTCNCSEGYIWSNEVCYNYSCCRETTCTQNVSNITPLCVAIVKVHINGTVILSASTWDSIKTTQLVTAFEGLNGFTYLNVTGQRQGNSIADFEAAVSVKFATSKLQGIVTYLEKDLLAVLLVDTVGMVTIEPLDNTVYYLSSPQIKCTFEEAMDSSGWNMSRKYERFELNKGSVVELDQNCSTKEYKSCVAITLQNVTGIWEGTYECGFTSGSVRHTAKTQLNVALLPDVIDLKINPLTADCSIMPIPKSVDISITATILASTESFEVTWSYMGELKSKLDNTSVGDYLVYSFRASISCQKTINRQYVNVTFKNTKEQVKSAQVDIPVLYEGAKFCSEESQNGEFWPKTPAGDTVINRTCTEGRTGYKSRTCEVNTAWQLVYSYCINEELNKVLNAADNFLKGLGATQAVAMDIFEGLKNSSTLDSDSSDTMADIIASINILGVMAIASNTIVLQEDVFPNFITAASSMLNKTWDGVNQSTVHNMSSNYLHSVEGLVKNIKVNNCNGMNSQNLEFKFCSSNDCNVSVFDIGVNLNKTTGIMKTIAVKNLMNKLRNSFGKTVPTSLLVSATLEDNSDSSLKIMLDFPTEQLKPTKPFCVFWNITKMDWSDAGCIVKTSDSNHTLCECNHLTSFSVLMAKHDISTEVLDIITNVGLGVSICSLLIFLIIESLVWSAVVKSNLSHFRHTALVNIAMFLLLADCSFFASTSRETLSDTWCLVLTICKHLFFLAMFSWMLCMSVMLVHQLIFVFSPLRKRVFMFLSSIVGYVCPILIVGSSYVYCKYTNKPYHDPKICWLVYEKLLEGSMHAFLLPVGTVILTNLFSMVVVIITLLKSSVPDSSKADDKETAKSILKVVVFLTPVFGVTWVFGFALLLLKKDDPMFTFANYTFTILNSFQGLLLLLTGFFAEQKVGLSFYQWADIHHALSVSMCSLIYCNSLKCPVVISRKIL
ncbi:adhesion G-protein coupled receptor F1 isoform X2 [Siniperca chuatsi]|uniref:adhesion G-protein coupled receptor F1 isoform X2 n=1 Tax=Siniperca chuatsi TaxID=119488 RepID=UPI001CE0644C|nr:adhesion G-protein coupled receptor F1 isoform X2 [Siniperca chuatsi]